jgi:hypothetical protein
MALASVILCGIRNYGNRGKSRFFQNFKVRKKRKKFTLKLLQAPSGRKARCNYTFQDDASENPQTLEFHKIPLCPTSVHPALGRVKLCLWPVAL